MKYKKFQKLVCNLYDQNNFIAHIRTLKQALNYGLILKELHKLIQYNQRAWLKPYVYMNIQFRTKAKNHFEKDFLKKM